MVLLINLNFHKKLSYSKRQIEGYTSSLHIYDQLHDHMAPQVSDINTKIRQLENYVTNTKVNLLFLNPTQSQKWTEIHTEILSIAQEKTGTYQNLKDRLVTVQGKINQYFLNRTLDKDDTRLYQINTLFNMRFTKIKTQIQECIQACEPVKNVSLTPKIQGLLSQLKALQATSSHFI